MPRFSRRTLLASAGLGGTVAAGFGYRELTNDPPNRAKVELAFVTIGHEQSHTVDLLIVDGEEPIYLQSKTFEGAEDASDPYDVGDGTFEDLPEEAGEYVVWFQLDGRRWDKFDFSEHDSLPAGWEEGEFPDGLVFHYTIGHEGREEGPPAVSLTVNAADEVLEE